MTSLPPVFEDYDLSVQLAQLEEYAHRFLPKILYRHISVVGSAVDDIYHEAELDEREYYDPIEMNVWVKYNPSQQLLLQMGIEQRRDLELHFPEPILVEAKLARRQQTQDPTAVRLTHYIAPGDLISYDGVVYQLVEIVPPIYWGNTNYPLYIRATCLQLRAMSSGALPTISSFTSAGVWTLP